MAAGPLTFEPVRADVFRAFAAGVAAGRAGGTAPAVFNAANEVAVAAFLDGSHSVRPDRRADRAVLDGTTWSSPRPTLEAVRGADRWARARAQRSCRELLQTIVALIVVLGVLVFVHELGHFLAAKWAGIRVYRFSLGMGAPIPGSPSGGGTEYAISWLPLGGYVKMATPEEDATSSVLEGRPRTRRSRRTRSSSPSRYGSG